MVHPIQARILLADDDRLILMTLAEGLTEAGFSVLTASNGEQALELCRTERPDLALLDIRMPGLDGIALANRLRAEVGVPFVMLTAYDDAHLVRDAVEAGALGYLVKPVDVVRIIPQLQAALARSAEIDKFRDVEESLGAVLATNRQIATAVGILMERHCITAEMAFEGLRRFARDHRRKVCEVANEVMLGGRTPFDRPPEKR